MVVQAITIFVCITECFKILNDFPTSIPICQITRVSSWKCKLGPIGPLLKTLQLLLPMELRLNINSSSRFPRPCRIWLSFVTLTTSPNTFWFPCFCHSGLPSLICHAYHCVSLYFNHPSSQCSSDRFLITQSFSGSSIRIQ